MLPPGHAPGHLQPADPGGPAWGDVVAWWVEICGSLAGAAERIAAERGHREGVETVERGLRRLRGRGQQDGGVWGRRGLAALGLPAAAVDRVRWMGCYHSRFGDLPVSLCEELLLPWDRPPVDEAPARAWLKLARAGLALRRRREGDAIEPLEQAARAAPRAGPGAVVEHRLAAAFVYSRRDPPRLPTLLDEAEAALSEAHGRERERDVACWRARLVDQRAYPMNRPPPGQPPDHAAALALYESLPSQDAPPFALCRRANGIAWSRFKLDDRDGAIAAARAGVSHAGDAGSLRLRAMALLALARFLGGDEGAAARARARAIAARLEDEVLLTRSR